MRPSPTQVHYSVVAAATECHCLQKLARPRIVPIVAAVSAPSPGCVLIELDTLYVLQPNRPWFAPITWLLPDKSVSQVHMKIGVNGGLEGGKVRPTWEAVSGCLVPPGAGTGCRSPTQGGGSSASFEHATSAVMLQRPHLSEAY